MLQILDSMIYLFDSGFGEGLNWLGNCVKWIVEVIPNVGVGIILFTLIVKLLSLPLDIYSKASMRKNSLKMEKMRPQLEKLQKQYQNDPKMYNTKMAEMYKKNGYSMMGACLPMIVTMVLFFFVLGAFSDYSAYTNVDVYRRMTVKYNEAILTYAPDIDAQNSVSVVYRATDNLIDNEDGTKSRVYEMEEEYRAADKLLFIKSIKTATLPDGLNVEDGAAMAAATDWNAVEAKLDYYVISERVAASEDEKIKAAIETVRADESNQSLTEDKVMQLAIKTLGREAAQQQYQADNSHFLWVKNVWLPDTHYTHPVKLEAGVDEQLFNEITKNLEAEKSAMNGYYILIIISIGTMFLSQFIMMKSQKAQNELQTADGRGQSTQKVMMVMMPIMFGIFSFFYSAAFSIYMVTSNILAIVSTALVNLVIDRKDRAREEQEIQEKYNKRIPQAARKAAEKTNGGKRK